MRDPQNDQLLSRLQSGDERALAELADTLPDTTDDV